MSLPSAEARSATTRVTRTFAFIDLCGFTDFCDSYGDDAAVAELVKLRASVRAAAPLFGVRVDKWLGDGVMLVGVDVEPIVAAVVAICNQIGEVGELPMRAGIASGPVIILEGDDYVGKAVNTAARLCDRAGAGVILAATDGLVLPEWVEAEGRPPLRVRGLAEPVQIASLSTIEGASPHATALAPAAAIMSVVDGLVRPLRALKRA
ncbi:MAG: adenylate/guanylate cyclase domain-containing protein [Acidimicrobiia bacterium]|nr:adenylate/guanylate cyclase domain-containing protein [Acidimicrobiia bacterium]